MKKYYLFAGLALLAASPSFAQVKIGAAGAPDGSAMLEVTSGASGNKGLLLPRMTLAQRNAIPAPATGLMIYNTTANQVQVNTGTPAAPIWVVATATNSGWDLTGNSGTNPATNFIGTSDAQALIVRTDNTERLRVTAAGNMGIGTTSPTQKLHVADTGDASVIVTAAAGKQMRVLLGSQNHGMMRNLTNSGGNVNDVALYTSSNIGTGDLHLIANPAATGSDSLPIDQFVLKPTGNIGIGTNTPVAKLQVVDTGDVSIRVGNSNGGRGHIQLGNNNHGVMRDLTASGGGVNDVAVYTSTGSASGNTTADLHLVANPVAGGSDNLPLGQFVLKNTGKVGIGTADPQQTLHVAGTARITGSTGTATTIAGRNAAGDVSNVTVGAGLSLTGGTLTVTGGTNDWDLTGNAGTNPATNFIGTSDAQPLVIRTDNTEKVRVAADGQVGIGTAAPTQTLDIVGTARIRNATGTPTTITGRNAAGDVGTVTLGSGLSLTGGVLNTTADNADWNLTGNTGTNPATNFIGTIDSQSLVIRTDNTEQVRVTAAGKVGINNTNPLSPLSFASATGSKISFFSSGTTNHYGFGVSSNQLNYHVNPGATHTFFAGGTNGDGTELMRIQSNGDVGIGTSAPAQTLHVAGTARIATATGTPTTITGRNAAGDVGNVAVGTGLTLTAGTLSVTGGTNDWDLTGNAGTNPATNFIGTSDNQPLVVRTNNTEKVRVTAAGNVGIGNTAPIFALDVAGGIRLQRDTLVASNGGSSILWNSVNLGRGETEFINYHGTGTGGFRFHNLAPGTVPDSAVGELMRITGDGAVGIGTGAPAQTLHVAGTARISTAAGTPTTITGRNAVGDVGNVAIGTGLSLTAGTLSVTGGTNDWDLTGNAGTNPATNFIGTSDAQPLVVRTNNTEKVRVTAAGNVGINNNNPLSPLSFASALGAKVTFWNGGSTTNHFGIGVSNNQLNYHVTPGAAHTFQTGGINGDGTELMRIQSNGNVGIGTQTPATKLNVNGGSLTVSTDATTPNIPAPIIHVVNDGGGPNFNDDVDIFSYGASTTPEFGMWTARGTASNPQAAQTNDYAGVLRFGTWVGPTGAAIKTELNRIQSTYTGNGTTEQSRLTFHATSASTPLMSIESNGNVGIGTITPTALLSVNGAANNTTGAWSIFSDARVKTVDGEYEDGLAAVMKIHPVKFHYNANAPFKSTEQQIGIIAQEMEQIAPYMVSKIKSAGFDDLRQYNNQALPYMLVNAIQEQQAQIEILKAKNEQLEAKNEQLEAANKVTAQLMERVKQMEQMMGITEIEGTSTVAGK